MCPPHRSMLIIICTKSSLHFTFQTNIGPGGEGGWRFSMTTLWICTITIVCKQMFEWILARIVGIKSSTLILDIAKNHFWIGVEDDFVDVDSQFFRDPCDSSSRQNSAAELQPRHRRLSSKEYIWIKNSYLAPTLRIACTEFWWDFVSIISQ